MRVGAGDEVGKDGETRTGIEVGVGVGVGSDIVVAVGVGVGETTHTVAVMLKAITLKLMTPMCLESL